MLIYTAICQLSVVSLHWIIIPEILSDVQLGFVSTVHYMNGVEISLVSEWMVNHLQPYGLILFYCIFQIFALFFTLKYMKETKGLTDKEKKELYMPPKDVIIQIQIETVKKEMDNIKKELETIEGAPPEITDSLEDEEAQKQHQADIYAEINQDSQRTMDHSLELEEHKISRIESADEEI